MIALCSSDMMGEALDHFFSRMEGSPLLVLETSMSEYDVIEEDELPTVLTLKGKNNNAKVVNITMQNNNINTNVSYNSSNI